MDLDCSTLPYNTDKGSKHAAHFSKVVHAANTARRRLKRNS